MDSTLRMVIGVPIAALVTLLLFLSMAQLIKQDLRLEEKKDPLNINITQQIEDTDLSNQKKEFKRPTLDNVPPPPPVIADADLSPELNGLSAKLPTLDRGTTGKINTANFDRDAQPLVRIPPQYPERCQSRASNLESIRVKFDVTPTGEVVNAKVIEASSSCFNRSALRAVEKWKYRPKVIEGNPQARRGVETTISFQLAE